MKILKSIFRIISTRIKIEFYLPLIRFSFWIFSCKRFNTNFSFGYSNNFNSFKIDLILFSIEIYKFEKSWKSSYFVGDMEFNSKYSQSKYINGYLTDYFLELGEKNQKEIAKKLKYKLQEHDQNLNYSIVGYYDSDAEYFYVELGYIFTGELLKEVPQSYIRKEAINMKQRMNKMNELPLHKKVTYKEFYEKK